MKSDYYKKVMRPAINRKESKEEFETKGDAAPIECGKEVSTNPEDYIAETRS